MTMANPAVLTARWTAALLLALPMAAFAAPPTAPAGETPPPTTAAAPAAAPPACGNRLLEASESCKTCPADCQAAPCKPAGRRTATVSLTPQAGYETIGAATLLLAYRSDRLGLPDTGNTSAVQARLAARQSGAQLFVNDLDHAVRIGVTSPGGLHPGAALTVAFDACQGAAPPTAADLACRIESCASGGVPTRGCTCSVTLD